MALSEHRTEVVLPPHERALLDEIARHCGAANRSAAIRFAILTTAKTLGISTDPERQKKLQKTP